MHTHTHIHTYTVPKVSPFLYHRSAAFTVTYKYRVGVFWDIWSTGVIGSRVRSVSRIRKLSGFSGVGTVGGVNKVNRSPVEETKVTAL